MANVIDGTPVTSPTAGNTTLLKRVARTRRVLLTTFADVVDHVLRVEDINSGQTRAVERARMAVQAAKDSFITYSTQGFKYYDARSQIIFNANDDIGTVTSVSGVVTPAVAPTWPSWMDLGQLRIDRRTYPVVSYVAGTSATVEGLPDGTYTEVTLQQGMQRLPLDFRRRGSLSDGNRTYPITDTSTGLLRSWEDFYEWANSSANPVVFGAIAGDQRFHGELMLAVWPTYSEEKVLSLYYDRYMSDLRYHRAGAGTVTSTGTALVASEANFTSEHIGSAIMFSTDNAEEIRSSLSDIDLVSDQRIITDVTDTTNATIDQAVTGDIAAKTFYISDIVDVMPGSMEQAFLRLAEYEMARASKSKTTDRKFKEFRMQMDIAMCEDARSKASADDTASFGWGYGIGDVTGRPDL